jgi:hypothetical protein
MKNLHILDVMICILKHRVLGRVTHLLSFVTSRRSQDVFDKRCKPCINKILVVLNIKSGSERLHHEIDSEITKSNRNLLHF